MRHPVVESPFSKSQNVHPAHLIEHCWVQFSHAESRKAPIICLCFLLPFTWFCLKREEKHRREGPDRSGVKHCCQQNFKHKNTCFQSFYSLPKELTVHIHNLGHAVTYCQRARSNIGGGVFSTLATRGLLPPNKYWCELRQNMLNSAVYCTANLLSYSILLTAVLFGCKIRRLKIFTGHLY